MLQITETEKSFLLYFYRQGSQLFQKKPLVYATEIGISETNYMDCLKNLSRFGYIENLISTGTTDIKLTSTGISYCREIDSLCRLSYFEKIINHLERRNNIYVILISLLALIVSTIALMK